MTDQISQKGTDSGLQTQTDGERDSQVSGNRRALIKGAAGTLPMILTLQSGAALARSSNLLASTNDVDSAKDKYGRTLCLDVNSVVDVGNPSGHLFDLGEPAWAKAEAIRDRRFFKWDPYTGLTETTTEEMCLEGGEFVTKRRFGMKRINVTKGVLMSAATAASFAEIDYDQV